MVRLVSESGFFLGLAVSAPLALLPEREYYLVTTALSDAVWNPLPALGFLARLIGI